MRLQPERSKDLVRAGRGKPIKTRLIIKRFLSATLYGHFINQHKELYIYVSITK